MRSECKKCPHFEPRKSYCGYAVVEGRWRCKDDGMDVGLGEEFVSPFKYEEWEERE